MKSYYSITLVTAFAILMSILSLINAARTHTDLSNPSAAVAALSICAVMLAYRLSQAEKRIAHLENKLENKDEKAQKHEKQDE